jgi:hypothetical protein
MFHQLDWTVFFRQQNPESLIDFVKIVFYFPHMKYGKVLVSLPENPKKNFAFFHFLGLIMPKKHFAIGVILCVLEFSI